MGGMTEEEELEVVAEPPFEVDESSSRARRIGAMFLRHHTVNNFSGKCLR